MTSNILILQAVICHQHEVCKRRLMYTMFMAKVLAALITSC